MARPYSFTFSIVPDADAAIVKGSRLDARVMSFRPDPVFGLREVRNLGHYGGALGYLSFFRDNWLTIEGSATLVAPGVAVTAFHVIEELIEHIVSGQLQMRLFCPAQKDSIVWNVRVIRRVENHDLALLSLTPSTQLTARRRVTHLGMCAIPPPVGETVMISGFRAGTDIVPVTDDVYFPMEENNALHGIRLLRSVGRVVKQDRNHNILIQIDAPTEGGMSGGPAFNEKGECFGVLISSITFEDGTGLSRIQALWPSFSTRIPSQIFEGDVTVQAYPAVKISGMDRIRIDELFPDVFRVSLLSAIEV